jgi:hypothetical protein
VISLATLAFYFLCGWYLADYKKGIQPVSTPLTFFAGGTALILHGFFDHWVLILVAIGCGFAMVIRLGFSKGGSR